MGPAVPPFSFFSHPPFLFLLRHQALFDFAGEMACDLTFKKGDTITLLTRTAKTEDWWEGQVVGTDKIGIFPANYVRVL